MKIGEFDKALAGHLRRLVKAVEVGMGDRDGWSDLQKSLLTEINTLRRNLIEIISNEGKIKPKEKTNG